MKIFSNWRMFALLALGLMVAGIRAEAQGFGLSATGSANSIAVSNSLTYTIVVTNQTGSSQTVTVSNILSAPVLFLGVGLPPLSIAVTNGNSLAFGIQMDVGGVAQMTLTVEPTQAGFITNWITVFGGDATNTTYTHVTTQVTNVVRADLAVGMTVPASAVFANDWMVYGVSVTNLGPNSATNVMLTNTLPTTVGYKSVSPAITRLGSSNIVIFSLGTLTNQAFKNFQLTVQPTNAGTLPFVSVVGTNGIFDPNPANNTASNNITVTNYFASQLTVVTNSGQVYNSQDGLVEQSIQVSNTGTNAIAAARVVVTGLTNLLVNAELVNAVGTNNGSPFVVYAAPLDTNQSVNLLLQFFAVNYFQLSNSQLHAFAVAVPNLTPPAAAVSTNVNITRILKLTNGSPLIIGSMLIEWPSITNRTYTVVYNNDLSSTNWLIAPPSVVAPANRTQWIDYGPPTTVSAPPNSSNRFYRVFLDP